MYDPDKRVLLDVNLSVEEFIDELRRFPMDATVSICGAFNAYIHAETDDDGNVTSITIDPEPLDEEYPENAFDEDKDDDEDAIVPDMVQVDEWLSQIDLNDRDAVAKAISETEDSIRNSVLWASGSPDKESRDFHLMHIATMKEYINRLNDALG